MTSHSKDVSTNWSEIRETGKNSRHCLILGILIIIFSSSITAVSFLEKYLQRYYLILRVAGIVGIILGIAVLMASILPNRKFTKRKNFFVVRDEMTSKIFLVDKSRGSCFRYVGDWCSSICYCGCCNIGEPESAAEERRNSACVCDNADNSWVGKEKIISK
ncbi:uncharacterized protein LOC111622398 [Centruroides sculpturatus]|uniref:uncharacterized protein LOC111622398 n=1 Tax=Centruroides sculpturatus TaxID=218467 RepID=UPI000C6D7F53|nr:uncharacterized protein LOC111622398 [Centruroides sculpturatus]